MNYLYKKEIDYIKYLKENSPKRIWWNYVNYIFDYDSFYFKLDCSSEIANSPNKSDEAIIANFFKVNEKYIAEKNSALVIENFLIEEIFIARTFLYYTKSTIYTEEEKKELRKEQLLNPLILGKEKVIDNMLRQVSSGYEEIICHPKSHEAQNINPEFANLLDCGLLIKINGKFLKAFIEYNGFGFHVINHLFFHSKEEIESCYETYEFMKLE